MKPSTQSVVLLGACSVFMGLAGAHSQSLPTSYDLRSVNGAAWVSAIQNQGHAEDCWTFASATAMDSSLLRSGLLPTSPTPPASYVSAWHLSTNNGAPDQLEASEAFSENTNWGGDLYQTLGYVTRGTGQWQIPNATRERVAGGFRFQQTMGGGPVFNSQNPLNPFPVSITGRGYPAYLGSLVPPASQVIPYRVSSMSIYEQGFANNVPLPPKTGTVTIGQATYDTYTFNQGAADPQVAVIKNALLSSGAVTTGMNAGRDLFVNTMNTIQYFNNRNATGYANHAVTIIGWNDAYTMTNPTTHVSSTGAWLVQNSWGLWDDGDGTFWASYNDAVIGRLGTSTFSLIDNAPYATTVLQNELGPMDYSGHYTATAGGATAGTRSPTGMDARPENIAASVLTPTQNGQLLALGLFTQRADVLVEFEIHDSWSNGPSTLLARGNYTFSDIGYAQVDLPERLSLVAGDEIVVKLTYLDSQTRLAAQHAVPVTIGGSGLNGYTDVTEGLSYYWSGSAWVDYSTVEYQHENTPGLNSEGGILFLKGITAVPEPSTLGLALLGGLAFLLVARRSSIATPIESVGRNSENA